MCSENLMRWKKPWTFYLIYHIKTMETNCVSCKNNTENENLNVREIKRNRLMLSSN